jgi:hypothetical protein
MMKTLTTTLALLLWPSLILLMTGCGKSQPPQPNWVLVETGEVEIARVFMNKPVEYVVLEKHGANEYKTRLFAARTPEDVKIVADVPADKPMKLVFRRYRNNDKKDDFKIAFDIHIHTPKEINGGAWTEEKTEQSGKNTKKVTIDGKVKEIE